MNNIISTLLENKKMTTYQCSKMSDIPYTTLLEIVNGKTDFEKCSVDTVYKLAKTLGVTVEFLMEHNNLSSFETFKSNIKHLIKEKGDFVFLIDTYLSNDINNYWNSGNKAKSLYLLATVDYLSRINDLPLAKEYDELRKYTLEETVFPSDICLLDALNPNSGLKKDSYNTSIPEFKMFNIVEKDIRDVA